MNIHIACEACVGHFTALTVFKNFTPSLIFLFQMSLYILCGVIFWRVCVIESRLDTMGTTLLHHILCLTLLLRQLSRTVYIWEYVETSNRNSLCMNFLLMKLKTTTTAKLNTIIAAILKIFMTSYNILLKYIKRFNINK